VTTPLAFVEAEGDFDKNPRLETVVGFFYSPATAGLNKKQQYE
jgi:hypothetical protein